jgi:voltage-gated potassium channel
VDAQILKDASPLFADVPDDALTKVSTFAHVEEYTDGQAIVREGDFANDFYVIEDGKVRVEREGEKLATKKAGEVFGEQALIEKSERSASVIAEGRVRVLVIEHWELARMRKAMPEVIEKLHEAVQKYKQD